MKALLGMALAAVMATSAFGDGMTNVTINGKQYSNITDVHLTSDKHIMILFAGGGISPSADAIPTDFLQSWKISKETQDAIKASEATKAARNLESAIATGCFREIDGIVYDTRKPQSGWVVVNNVKVIQIVDDGAIVNTTPGDYYQTIPAFIKHLPAMVSDTDFISFSGRPVGNYSYINKLGDGRTIRAYDLGRVCSRDEIPESVLSGKKPFDMSPLARAPKTDVIASLPDSEELKASGTGFFITGDGYLITNNHVVRRARKVKVKIGGSVFPAEIVRVDADNDLALLKAIGQFSPLSISTNDVQLGESVFTIGFPNIDMQGTEPKYTDGKISSLAGLRDDPKECQISVPVQPGNSGGPLVDTAGNVKGVVVARLDDMAALVSSGQLPQNVNYAIKGKVLRDFLAQSPDIKLANKPLPGGSSLAQTVQQSVAIILVY